MSDVATAEPTTATEQVSDDISTPSAGEVIGNEVRGGEVSAGEVLIVTDAAKAAVLEIRQKEEDADALGLRVEITGVAGIDYQYDLCLDPVSEAGPDDHIHTTGELTVIVPAASIALLRGATLDMPSSGANGGGLVIRNPNRPNPLGDMGTLELSGSVEDKVNQLLEMRVNPALASHGGYASLVKVEDDKVVVTMGGGCQGCAMSQATLSQGIRQAILEAIPEVSDVIDATDHTAGENPYFT